MNTVLRNEIVSTINSILAKSTRESYNPDAYNPRYSEDSETGETDTIYYGLDCEDSSYKEIIIGIEFPFIKNYDKIKEVLTLITDLFSFKYLVNTNYHLIFFGDENTIKYQKIRNTYDIIPFIMSNKELSGGTADINQFVKMCWKNASDFDLMIILQDEIDESKYNDFTKGFLWKKRDKVVKINLKDEVNVSKM